MQKRKRGQSLVEVTVALSILGITMMGVLTLAINVIGYSISTKSRSQAVGYAQEGLEVARSFLRSCSELKISILEGQDFVVDSGTALAPGASEAIGDFTRTITIRSLSKTEDPDGDGFPEDILIVPNSTYIKTDDFYLITSKVEWNVKGTKDGKTTVYGVVKRK